MPTKQELMQMMDNQLPGEPVTSGNSDTISTQPPPSYADIEGSSSEQPKPCAPQSPSSGQIYSISQQPAANYQPTQFGARAHLAYCPSCHVTQMTRCEYENSMMTHIIATILCCTTCICCCLPYLFDNCKSARHFCQNCGTYLGAKNK